MKRNSLYIYGSEDIYVPSDLHFGRYVLENILKHEEDIALKNVENGCEWSFREIAQQAINVAISLAHAGVKKGQVVAVCSEPRLELVTSALGILCAGATVANIDGTFHEELVQKQLRLSQSKIIFTSPKFYNKFRNLCSDAEYGIKTIVVFDDQYNEQKDVTLFQEFVNKTIKVEEFEAVAVNGIDDVALICFTSGTTGNQKGIQLTHHALLMNLEHYVNRILKKGDRVLSYRNWSSCLGFKFVFTDLCAGASVYFPPGDLMTAATLEVAKNVYRYIERHQISVLLLGPGTLRQLLSMERPESNPDMSSLRVCLLMATHLDTTQANKLKRLLNISGLIQFYGMSETGLISSEYYLEVPCEAKHEAVFPPSGDMYHDIEEEIKPVTSLGLMSVGRLCAGVTLKIVDMQTGAALGVNQLGEICVKTYAMMTGYIGRERGLDELGWLRTGDAGHYDPEGRVYLWDRLTDLLHVDGHIVSPSTLEGALLRYPGIVDAGVTLCDGLRAYLVVADGVTISEQDVQKYVESLGVAGARLTGGVRAVSRLPRTIGGKLLRRTLPALSDFATHAVRP